MQLSPAWCCGEWVEEMRTASRWNCKVTSFICSHLWTSFVCRILSYMLVSLYLLCVTNLIYVVTPIPKSGYNEGFSYEIFLNAVLFGWPGIQICFSLLFFYIFCNYFILYSLIVGLLVKDEWVRFLTEADPSIYFEGRRKTPKNLSLENFCPGRNSKFVPSEQDVTDILHHICSKTVLMA